MEGERFLDFLRFCVWVNGESVEENANLVIRLLIRRPECLGPALRGEGEGLMAAIISGNCDYSFSRSMACTGHLFNTTITGNETSERIAELVKANVATNPQTGFAHPLPACEDDEDWIDTGAAMLNFYCTLVDLLGRY